MRATLVILLPLVFGQNHLLVQQCPYLLMVEWSLAGVVDTVLSLGWVPIFNLIVVIMDLIHLQVEKIVMVIGINMYSHGMVAIAEKYILMVL